MNRVESSNDWNAGHYDEHIGYVSRLGRGVVDLLKRAPGERILDLGCGTGDLAHLIRRSGAYVLGMDQSEAMIVEARAKFPEQDWIQGDGETFRLPGVPAFDAVFSNAALHWMKRPGLVAASVHNALRTEGRFVAEFGGKGNVEQLVKAILQSTAPFGVDGAARYPWYFPSVGEYTGLLEEHGFEVGYAELFDRPTPLSGGEQGLRHWLKAFAGMFFDGLTEEQQDEAYRSCERMLKPVLWNGDTWVADYRRIRVVAVKK